MWLTCRRLTGWRTSCTRSRRSWRPLPMSWSRLSPRCPDIKQPRQDLAILRWERRKQMSSLKFLLSPLISLFLFLLGIVVLVLFLSLPFLCFVAICLFFCLLSMGLCVCFSIYLSVPICLSICCPCVYLFSGLFFHAVSSVCVGAWRPLSLFFSRSNLSFHLFVCLFSKLHRTTTALRYEQNARYSAVAAKEPDYVVQNMGITVQSHLKRYKKNCHCNIITKINFLSKFRNLSNIPTVRTTDLIPCNFPDWKLGWPKLPNDSWS